MGQRRKLWVFIDSQNLYKDARRAFHDPDTDPSSYGQIWPDKLAELIASLGPEDDPNPREIAEVRVYTGFPSSSRDPKGYGAHMKQRAAWLSKGVRVVPRPLRYPPGWPGDPPQEKGIDVSLAVDLVFGAARRSFDIGIVVSTDTDLVPALEAVTDLQRAWGTPRIEVASWKPTRKRLSVAGHPIWCHWLDEADYEKVRDTTLYVSGTSKG